MARAALATPTGQAFHIVLLNREARCDSAGIRPTDMALEFDVPAGPDRSFFAGRFVPLPLRIHGAGGIDTVPSTEAVVRMAPVSQPLGRTISGLLRFEYRTGLDEDAPRYASKGLFQALVCSNGAKGKEREGALMPSPGRVQGPVSGRIGAKLHQLQTAHIYLRKDGSHRTVLSLRLYAGRVPCFTKRSATPYLFAELGPGPDRDYFAGRLVPLAWNIRVRKDAFSERTVRAEVTEGWVLLKNVRVRRGAKLRGKLYVDHAGRESFSFSGTFEAKICGAWRASW